MNVYVIGSCRVHGPLRGRPEYVKGVEGYTHTAREAIQRIKFVRGRQLIPNEIAPYVFLRDRPPAITPAHKLALDSADVVLVEVCSEKNVFHDGHWVNLNYAEKQGLNIRLRDRRLKTDLSVLVGMVNRLVVVQHVELPGIEPRSRFAAEVREACGELYIPVFNPSVHVVESEMLDVNHYKPKVISRMGDRLLEFLKWQLKA